MAGTLVDALRRREVVLFFGSAVSMFGPSVMPAGGTVTEVVKRRLKQLDCRGRYQPSGRMGEIWAAPCFEGILALQPALDIEADARLVVSFLRTLYGASDQNSIHRAIALLLESGLVGAVVTTNYDTCVEAAYGQISNGAPLSVVSAEQDLAGLDRSRPLLFKIHGSIDSPEGLVFSLYQEFRGLPVWKRALLSNLLSGRQVFFFGYSGYDFDICPFLLGQAPPIEKVHWSLNMPTPPTPRDLVSRTSPEAQKLLANYPCELHRDFRLAFRDIASELAELAAVATELAQLVEVDQKGLTRELVERTEAAFSESFADEDELRLWLLAVLARIGLGAEVLENASDLSERWRSRDRVSGVRQSELAKRFGEAYFHLGKYRRAEYWFREAARQAREAGSPGSRVLDLELSALEAARCQLGWRHYGRVFVGVLLGAAVRSLNALTQPRDELVRTRGKLLERLGQAAEFIERAAKLTRPRRNGATGKWVALAKVRLYEGATRQYRAAGDHFSASDLDYRLGRTEVAEQYERLGYALGRVNQLRSEARLLLSSNRREAERRLRKSVGLARLIDDAPGLAKGLYILSELLASNGRHVESRHAYVRAVQALSTLELRIRGPEREVLRRLSLS